MRLVFAIFLYLISPNSATSQSYNGNADDTIKLRIFIDSVNHSPLPTYNDVKDIIYRAKKIVAKNDNYYYGVILTMEGLVFFENTNYAKAAILFDSAGNIFRRLKQNQYYGDCLNKAGLCYVYNSNYILAKERLFGGLAISEKLDDKILKSNLYANIGLLFESLEDWDNAIHFAHLSLTMDKQMKNAKNEAKCENNIGNLFTYQKKYDSALVHLKRSYNLHKRLKNIPDMLTSLENIGFVFSENNKTDSALFYFKQALVFVDSSSDKNGVALLYANISVAYTKTGNTALAGKYAMLAKELGKPIDDYHFKQSLYSSLIGYYKAINDLPNAMKYMEELQTVTDSINEQSKNIEFQKTAIKYELARKFVADSLIAEQKVFVANAATIKTRNSLLILALLLVIALALAIILYNRSKLLKRKNIIIEQEKQIAEQLQNTYQLKTLQAQMNPHFVFNCFSTIDAFIIQNKQLDASQLVQRFSKLSRRILKQTKLNYISLNEELETLEIYLQIERTRSSNKFNFTIEKHDDLLAFQIPPMLLQPFVENAVIHGVRNLQHTDGLIKISLSEMQNTIQIVIEDNGVGREKAAEIKQQKTNTHRSISMDLTLTRLKSLHNNSTTKYLDIIDLPSHTGTLIKITIPKIIPNA